MLVNRACAQVAYHRAVGILEGILFPKKLSYDAHLVCCLFYPCTYALSMLLSMVHSTIPHTKCPLSDVRQLLFLSYIGQLEVLPDLLQSNEFGT